MKKSVQPNSQQPQDSAVKSSGRSLRQTGAEGRAQSSLAQLAATINQSPRVQTQLKLAEELQGNAYIQKHAGAEATGVQLKGLKEKKPAQTKLEEKKPAQMKGKLEEKKPMQGKFEVPIQEKRLDEKKPAQTKPNEKKKPVQGRFEGSAAPAQREEVPAANRTGLPDQLKAGVESLSGASLDDVRVHYNSDKPKQLNALAYAQGTDIHVGPGQEKHLPHEAWHIVQQKQGRVRPTMQMKAGVPVNDDPGLEKEADAMGAKALQRIYKSSEDGDLPLKEGDAHDADCACPGCCQAQSVLSGDEKLQPAFLRTSPDRDMAQTKLNGTFQMKPCPECQKEKGHLSWCPRNKHNRRAKDEEKKEVRQESRAWKNLKHYQGNWVTDNNISESQVKKFCKETGRTIRGHASGDNSKGLQGITIEDLNVFKNWFTDKYGWQ